MEFRYCPLDADLTKPIQFWTLPDFESFAYLMTKEQAQNIFIAQMNHPFEISESNGGIPILSGKEFGSPFLKNLPWKCLVKQPGAWPLDTMPLIAGLQGQCI
jgi:hypothetical protein